LTSNNEKYLINIIKYTPPIFILLVAILTSIFITNEHKKNIKEEKRLIETQYILDEKKEIQAWVDSIENYIHDTEKEAKENLNNDLKDKVQNAYSIIESIYENNKDKKSKKEITKLIKDALKNIRFNNGRGYFFISEMKGKSILNSEFPYIENKNLWNYKDSSGTLIFQEANRLLKEKNETFFTWYWKKPDDSSVEYKKRGFLKKFEPYDWYVGTAEYDEDFNNKLKLHILNQVKKFRYKNGRYVFIVNKDGLIIANKFSRLEGTNLFEYENMKHLRERFRKLREKEEKIKGLFVEYEFIEESTSSINKKKISYVKLLEDWDWIIGTGFNLDNLNEVIIHRQKLLEEKYNGYLNKLLLLSIVFILILLLMSQVIAKYLEKIFYKYTKSLKSKQNKLLKAQEVAHIGDWQFNLDTQKATWSDEVYNIFGVDSNTKDVGLELLKTIIHYDDWEHFEKSFTNTIETKTEHQFIYRIIRPNDNTIKWIDCRGSFNKRQDTIYGTVQDISQRIKIEQENKEKEKLLYQQSKMAAMGEMLANIAHQWRQPLSAISTSATGIKIQEEMNLLTKKDLLCSMDNINNSAQYLSQTIEDFRTFFDTKNNIKKEFNLSTTIDKTLNLVSSQFTAKNILIVKNVQDIKINSLENELIQALMNILNNSKDALFLLEKNQQKLIVISVYKEKNSAVIKIQDSAGGISLSIIDRIFEPYFTTKHQSQGTGIGLYMTREIVSKLLNASIEVDNNTITYEDKEYKGAEFKITINLD